MNIGLLITFICSVIIFILNAKIMVEARKLQNYLIDELSEKENDILQMKEEILQMKCCTSMLKMDYSNLMTDNYILNLRMEKLEKTKKPEKTEKIEKTKKAEKTTKK